MNLKFQFLVVDNNEELLTETYRLRYQVYCEEVKFLGQSCYPDGTEKDIFDEHSIHFAAIDPQGNIVGTLRLILNSTVGFPLETVCPSLYIDKNSLPRKHLAEVSRLAIIKTKRRRSGDGLFGAESSVAAGKDKNLHYHGPERRRQPRKEPRILLGLLRALYQESKRREITDWYLAMEKKLWYAFKRMSFHYKAIGPEIDYYGPVIPYHRELHALEEDVWQAKPEYMHFLAAGLEDHLLPDLGEEFRIKHYEYVKQAKLNGEI